VPKLNSLSTSRRRAIAATAVLDDLAHGLQAVLQKQKRPARTAGARRNHGHDGPGWKNQLFILAANRAACQIRSGFDEDCCLSSGRVCSMGMSEVTRILSAIEQGDPVAAKQLLPLVYDELRRLAAQKLAHEKPGHTVDATALVHEAYLRLVGDQQFANRRHFLAAAAEAMRRILVESARRKQHAPRVDFADLEVVAATGDERLLELDDLLKRLAAEEPVAAKIVEARVFVGLSVAEAATVLGLSRATAYDRHDAVRQGAAADGDLRRNPAHHPRGRAAPPEHPLQYDRACRRHGVRQPPKRPQAAQPAFSW